MSANDVQQIGLGALQGLGASTIFVLALFIGFCVIVGFTKTKKTAGGAARVVKSLDERISPDYPITRLLDSRNALRLPLQSQVQNPLQHRVVADAGFFGRIGEILAPGNLRIGIRFEHPHVAGIIHP